MSNIFQALKFAPIAVVAVFLLILILSGYVKAPPDVAYIISGFRKTRVLVGRAGIKIPFLERLDKLSLQMISVDVKTTDFVPNSEYINVKVDATVKIRVGRDDELMQLAMANFLNAKEEQIVGKVQDTLEGNMREIIGQMKLSEMVTDRKAFGERVQENALPDQNGGIDDLGIDNVSRIKKDAAIAKAEADRDVAVKQAEADQAANEARVNAEKQIAEKQNELAIRQAELKKDADIKKAEADAAYEIQAKEQSKALETADVNAQIARAEREAELKEKQVLIAKQALDAEVRAQADAERYRQEQEAQAELFRRQKEAEACRYEQEQNAEAAKKAAEAAKFAKEQEAAGIAAVGKAEAEAIQARALAEAEGINKKAEAMQKYGEAAVVEMVMKALPEIAKNVAEPLSKVDKITMYGEGNSARLLADIVSGTTQVTEGISAGMGIDIKSLLAGMLGGKLAALAAPDINIPQAVEPAGKPQTDFAEDEQI